MPLSWKLLLHGHIKTTVSPPFHACIHSKGWLIHLICVHIIRYYCIPKRNFFYCLQGTKGPTTKLCIFVQERWRKEGKLSFVIEIELLEGGVAEGRIVVSVELAPHSTILHGTTTRTTVLTAELNWIRDLEISPTNYGGFFPLYSSLFDLEKSQGMVIAISFIFSMYVFHAQSTHFLLNNITIAKNGHWLRVGCAQKCTRH